jgi:hypothetical protein
MSAFGEVQTPGTIPVASSQEPPETVADRKQEEKIHEYADARLKSLVKTDEMYFALEYFLLGDPERQISQLGDTETLMHEGNEAKTKNENVSARTNYETAAKLEIYKGNKDAARRCLLMAQEVTDRDDKRFRLMTTLIDNMDEAISVAKSYYDILAKEVLPRESGQ